MAVCETMEDFMASGTQSEAESLVTCSVACILCSVRISRSARLALLIAAMAHPIERHTFCKESCSVMGCMKECTHGIRTSSCGSTTFAFVCTRTANADLERNDGLLLGMMCSSTC